MTASRSGVANPEALPTLSLVVPQPTNEALLSKAHRSLGRCNFPQGSFGERGQDSAGDEGRLQKLDVGLERCDALDVTVVEVRVVVVPPPTAAPPPPEAGARIEFEGGGDSAPSFEVVVDDSDPELFADARRALPHGNRGGGRAPADFTLLPALPVEPALIFRERRAPVDEDDVQRPNSCC